MQHTEPSAHKRLTIDLDNAPSLPARQQTENPTLLDMSDEDKKELLLHLHARLGSSSGMRTRHLNRYVRIDRSISTWQKLDKNDSERERREDNTGRQHAIPMNIPILASHLSDMSSYFAEALAPIQDPFSASRGSEGVQAITKSLNEDALARDYYGELVLCIRSLLKYNLGGLHVEWDEGGPESVSLSGIKMRGNVWRSLDLYNTMWDPTVKNPADVPNRAEWGATIRLTNRIEMSRKALAGKWVGLEERLRDDSRHTATDQDSDAPELRLWRNPAAAVPSEDGQDSRTQVGYTDELDENQWQQIGLGIDENNAGGVDAPHEHITMYCWIRPAQFGMLNDATEEALTNQGVDVDVHIELWRFELLDGAVVMAAEPAIPSEEYIGTGIAQIPMYLTFLTRDQLGEAQRSAMELLRGFQRFSSAMFTIYTEGMRGNVWGIKGYDPQMFDISSLQEGQTAGYLASKQPGRDVRAGLLNIGGDSGVDSAMNAVSNSMGLMNELFPSQALPSQVAGMERAVTSQVSSVVQGAQRSMRMMLRLMDSSLMMPSRMAAVRNTSRYGDLQTEAPNDEDVARSIGSGIESMESERITEGLWRLMVAVIQNEEAMQRFDIPKLMSYIGRLMNLSVDLGEFARQQPQGPAQAPGQGQPPAQGQQPPPANQQ